MMRSTWISMALIAIATLCGVSLGGEGQQQYGPVMDGGEAFDPCCDPCDPCAGGGHHNRRQNRRNQEAGFNCGCNGSYKFPVPPLYTYHWPGMYSAQLMTDYHSPWRFPPLKPYVDEVPTEVLGQSNTLRSVQPAAAVVESTSASRPGSFSSHLESMLR